MLKNVRHNTGDRAGVNCDIRSCENSAHLCQVKAWMIFIVSKMKPGRKPYVKTNYWFCMIAKPMESMPSSTN